MVASALWGLSHLKPLSNQCHSLRALWLAVILGSQRQRPDISPLPVIHSFCLRSVSKATACTSLAPFMPCWHRLLNLHTLILFSSSPQVQSWRLTAASKPRRVEAGRHSSARCSAVNTSLGAGFRWILVYSCSRTDNRQRRFKRAERLV